MRIGIDCRLWEETGVGRYIRNLVLNLQKLDKKNEYYLFALKKDKEEILKRVQNDNFRILNSDIKWHTVKEQVKFLQILNRENLDLVHFPYFSVPIFYNRPFVVTIHDLIQNHYASGKASALPFLFYYIKKIGYRRVLGNAVKKAKQIIVPLKSVENDLVSTLKVSEDKIFITNEGFDPNIKRGEVSKTVLTATKNPYFLYVGNAYPHKNLEMLLKAFSTFNFQLSTFNLVLVGREDFFYKRLKKKENKNVIFLHEVTDSDLFYLYSNSVAAVSPSLMEGFGLFPLEALGVGAVPIVSNIPSFHEVCGDLAIYFDPKDPKDITEKLTKALKLKDSERREIKKKAEVWLKKFSWQKMAQQTLAVYEEVIG